MEKAGKIDKIGKLVRKEIGELEPYTCARDLYKEADAFLDANENSFGACISPVEGVRLNSYPDSDQNRLRDAIASYAGVERDEKIGKQFFQTCKLPRCCETFNLQAENILVGNGSDEIIDLCVRTFVGAGENIISVEPGYSMYGVCARAQGANVKVSLLGKDFQPDVKAILAQADAKTKMIFIVSPNSPVGAPVKIAKIEELARRANAVVFVDEAYVEFGGQSAAGLVEKYDNLIISRTFSKAWGLAGLRVGYAISNRKVISIIRRLKAPYNLNSLSSALALKALKSGREKMLANCRKIRIEREKLRQALEGLGFSVYPSVCNFLLAKPPLGAMTASRMQKEIAKSWIIVRDRSGMPTLQNTFRITIGMPGQNAKLLAQIRKLLKQGAKYDCVLFDMDGVLIDVSKSYIAAIGKTANDYLGNLEKQEKTGTGKSIGKRMVGGRGLVEGRRLIGREEIDAIKALPGFNNDWDATFALVRQAMNKESVGLAKPLTSKDRKGRLYASLKGKFQEYYLNGPIQAEKPLVDADFLACLKKSGVKLGIVTGRPRAEAEFAVGNNSWQALFPDKNIVALEDCDEEKPSPKPVLLAIARLGAKNPIYIGDNVSDYEACRKAGVPCIIIGNGTAGDWNIGKMSDLMVMV